MENQKETKNIEANNNEKNKKQKKYGPSLFYHEKQGIFSSYWCIMLKPFSHFPLYQNNCVRVIIYNKQISKTLDSRIF